MACKYFVCVCMCVCACTHGAVCACVLYNRPTAFVICVSHTECHHPVFMYHTDLLPRRRPQLNDFQIGLEDDQNMDDQNNMDQIFYLIFLVFFPI